jgi:hypothetical protein
LKEQNKYDQMPSDLLDRLQRILSLADEAVDEIVYEKAKNLEKTIERMFEVMYRVARFSCDYVKHGIWSYHLLDLASADGRSENAGRVDLHGNNRRNGQRIDEGHR